jgi:hypothetical protein
VTMMDSRSTLIFPSGENATSLAWYNQRDYSIYI